MTVNYNNSSYDDNYAEEHIENPIGSALANSPLYEAEDIGDSGADGALWGGIASLGGGAISANAGAGYIGLGSKLAVDGVSLSNTWYIPVLGSMAPGIAIGGVAASVAGILTEKYATTKKGKAFGRGLGAAGSVGAVVGGVSMLGLSFWPTLLAIIPATLAYSTLYYMLTGKHGKAKELLKKEVGEEKAVEVLAKAEAGVEEIKEKNVTRI